jgi:predicted nucleic acid-binding protein
MITYIDSSVVLRVVLGRADALVEWPSIVTGVASRLLEVECLRTIDRLCLLGQLGVEDAVVRRETVFRILEAVELVELSSTVMRRAAQPMPAPIGTLDAIHLATAELWRETKRQELRMATHDRALALAARGSGLRVIGA